MAARKRGRPRREDEDEDGEVFEEDGGGDDGTLPDDLMGSIESDGSFDFPDEPPEGWPS